MSEFLAPRFNYCTILASILLSDWLPLVTVAHNFLIWVALPQQPRILLSCSVVGGVFFFISVSINIDPHHHFY